MNYHPRIFKVLSILLILAMTLSTPITAFPITALASIGEHPPFIEEQPTEPINEEDEQADKDKTNRPQSADETNEDETGDISTLDEEEENTEADLNEAVEEQIIPMLQEFAAFNLDTWEATDFTYETISVSLKTHANANTVNVSGYVVSGFSESGELKLESITDLVIPGQMPDETPIVGVGKNAFSGKSISSVVFPSGMSNFLIQDAAFSGNNLTEVTIPSGVIQIGAMAFYNNSIGHVTLSDTVFYIGNGSFRNNQITDVIFPADSVTPVQVDNYAFVNNKIESVRLSNSMEKISEYVFMNNPGMEPSPSMLYDCGIVWMYTSNPADFTNDKIHAYNNYNPRTYSDYQSLVLQGPAPETNWTAADFTYSGTVITGLAESGLAKRAVDENRDKLVLPDKTPSGEWITEIAAATAGGAGLFGTSTEKFKAVVLPAQLEVIGNFAFQNNLLTTITFPETLTTIGTTAFQMNQLIFVNLPDSVTTLGNGVFASNTTLTSIRLSSGLEDIPASAFLCNTRNENFNTVVEIPYGVKTIGQSAFAGLAITGLTIPDTVTSIGNNAFNLHGLTSLVIPGSVKTIGNTAFGQCVDCTPTLSNLTLGEGIETIGTNAFRNGALTELSIPSSLTKLPANTFSGNTGYEGGKVYLYTLNPTHLTDATNFPVSTTHTIIQKDEWLAEDFIYEGTVISGLSASGIIKRASAANRDILVLPDKNLDEDWITGIKTAAGGGAGLFGIATEQFKGVILPARLEIIGNYAFQNNLLTTVTFPDTLIEIGMMAFNTNQLTSVYLPDSVTKLNPNAFGINQLTSIRLSNNLVDIPASAFMSSTQNTSITSLEIPYGVTTIGVSAFAGQGITSLTLPDTITSIGNTAFNQHRLTSLMIPGNVKSIGTTAFGQHPDGPATLTNLTLGEGIETIGNYAFRYAALTEVYLPSTLTSLPGKPSTTDNSPFRDNTKGAVTLYTSNPSHLSFPSSDWHSISFTAWEAADFTYAGPVITGYSNSGEAKRLINKHLELPDKSSNGTTITKVGDYAFTIPSDELTTDRDGVQSPNGMTSIKWPVNLQSIGERAFQYNNFTDLEFPETLTSIGDSAFTSNKLNRLVLPDSLTTLGEGAFASNYITNLTLSKGLTEIASGAFAANTSLKQLDLHEGLEIIGEFAFNGITIKSLEIPSTVCEIRRGAFHYHHIENLVIPGTVKIIGDSAFEGTPKMITMRSLTLNEGITTIGSAAFKVGHLSEVSLPSSLQSLGATAFKDNTGYNNTGIVRLYTTNPAHVSDKNNFPNSTTHTIINTNIPDDKEEYTVRFDANGGSGSMSNANISAGGSYTIPANDFTYGGFDFIYWNTLADGTGIEYAAGATITNINANITLYAQWKPIKKGNNNSGGDSGSSVKTPATPTITDTVNAGGNTITTPAGQPGVTDASGSTTLPGGGTVQTPSGAEIAAPAGTTIDKDGNITIPADKEAQIILPSGQELIIPGSSIIEADGDIVLGNGSAMITAGNLMLHMTTNTVIILDEETPLGYYIAFSSPFADVTTSNWFYDNVGFVYSHGLFQGTSSNTFSPNDSMTRAMLATVLARLSGADLGGYNGSRFADVELGAWYTQAIEWAATEGIANGFGKTFGPNTFIDREQLAVMICNYAKTHGYNLPSDVSAKFADESSISGWALEAVRMLQAAGIINGKDGNIFDPQGVATRAEVAAMIQRFVETIAEK